MKGYGSKELERCVKSLGFTFDSISSNHHAKYNLPAGRTVIVGYYPFFQFQLKRKTYDKNAQHRYITQLKRLGFTKEEIENSLK